MKEVETTYLEDGAIYLARDEAISPKWQARIKKPDGSGYLRKTTGTDSLDAAKLWALRELDRMKLRMQMGLTLNAHTFAEAVVLWERWLEAEVTLGLQEAWKLKQYKAKVKRYYLPYFGEKDIGAIRQADLIAYEEWRATYWTAGPGKGQKVTYVNKKGRTVTTKAIHGKGIVDGGEKSIFNAIMERAIAAGWLTEDKVPRWKRRRGRSKKHERQVRPCFTLTEYNTIVKGLQKWAFADGLPEIVRRYRTALRDFVTVMFNTGMRPHEALGLQWKHITYFNQKMGDGTIQRNVRLLVDGKTGARPLVGGIEVAVALTRIEMWMEDGITCGPDDYVFRLPTGERCKLADSCHTFLHAHNLAYDTQGKKRTQYSMRHTYATLKLLYSPGITYYELGRQMGTSPEIIERHYSHLLPEQIAAKLTHRKFGDMMMNADGSLADIADLPMQAA